MPEDLPLEPDLIKVLASDTRREILRLLRDRRMTVTELSRELELSKAAVHEHLKKLVAAELIGRDEDDRLWVYYELTPRGKRILNPQRTRFYLVVGIGILATIVVALTAALLWQAMGPSFVDEQASPTAQAVDVQLSDERLYEGGPVRVQAQLHGTSDADAITAYLVDAESADELRRGEPVLGVPLETQFDSTQSAVADRAAQDSADGTDREAAPSTSTASAELSTDEPLGAGTYYVYVVGPEGDNRERMPALEIAPLDVTLSSTSVLKGLSGPVHVEVSAGQTPVDGTIVLDRGRDGTNGTAVPLEEGTATVPPALFDDLPAGSYDLRVLPEGADDWRRLAATLEVQVPPVTVLPHHLAAGQATDVQILLGHTRELETAQIPIAVNGSPILDRENRTDAIELRLAPPDPSTVTLQVGRLAPIDLQAHRTIAMTVEIHDGPEHVLHLDHRDERPAEGIAVRLDGDPVGFTNASGEISLDRLPEGTRTLTIQLADDTAIRRALTVEGWDVEPLQPRLQIEPTGEAVGPRMVRLTVQIHNPSPAPLPATVLVEQAGTPAGSGLVDLPAEGNATTTLRVPVPTGGTHRFDVTVDGFTEPPLQVENRTTRDQAESEDDGMSGGGSTAADTTDDAAAREADQTSVEVAVSEETDAAGAEAGAALDGPRRERIPPEALAAPADGEAAETPSPGAALLLVVVVALAAGLARRRLG